MIEAVAIMGGLGVVIGACLAAASKIFYVYVDPLIVAVEDILPGANCGGCGYPGCSANAEAVVKGQSPPNSCVAAGIETAEAIAAVIGASVEAKEPDIARPGCYFGVQDADLKYAYHGLNDCRAAAMLGGGMKVCKIGCLGLGSCARACPFDAIVMGPENLPVVIAEKCTGCGTCERVCPKHIITLSSVTRRILREYTDDECTTPCQRECPAGIDIREYIRQIRLGDYRRSVQVIKERNPFPTVIGRICPRPCENECRRNFEDEPVAINYLKRFASDYEVRSGKRIQPYKAPATGRNVAVVGGGVEGMSAAFFSARLGHGVTLYEATDRLGGLLRSAIEKERLPSDILQWDIDGILDMGVTARTNTKLGKDISVGALLADGFDAVFLATGGWDSRLTRISGEDMESIVPGIYLMIDLIKSDTGRSSKLDPEKNVVIVGSGRGALEAGKICWDFGSEKVTVVMRESREQFPKKDLPLLEELEAESAFNIVFSAAVTQLAGEGDRLTDVQYIDLVTHEMTTVSASNLFVAAGRFPELIFYRTPLETVSEAESGPVCWTAVPPYKRPEYKDKYGLFAEGDAITDYSAAIRAIGAGRRGAASIHRVMYGIPLDLDEKVLTPDSPIQDVDHVEGVTSSPRQIMPLADARELREHGILEKGFTEPMAQKEANRCLQCGLICYEHSPVSFSDSKAVA